MLEDYLIIVNKEDLSKYNPVKHQGIVFDEFDPWPSTWPLNDLLNLLCPENYGYIIRTYT